MPKTFMTPGPGGQRKESSEAMGVEKWGAHTGNIRPVPVTLVTRLSGLTPRSACGFADAVCNFGDG